MRTYDVTNTANRKPYYALMSTIFVWIGLVLYWPTLKLGSLQLRADYPLALVMVFWLLLKMRFSWTTLYVASGLLILIMVMTIGSINGSRLGYEYSLLIFVGFLKPFVVLAVWIEILRYVHYERVLKTVVMLLLPAATLAILQILAPDIVTNLTLSWYSSEARTTASALFGEGGGGSRAIAVFESPVYSAIAFLVAALLAFMVLNVGSMKITKVAFVVFSFIFLTAGFFAGSSTFLIGLLLSGVLLAGWKFLEGKLGSVFLIFFAGVFGVLLLWYALASSGNEAFTGEIRYQIEKVTSLSFFMTRFGPEGQLAGTVAHWPEYILFGLGSGVPDYFVGDNLYVATLVRSGIFGLLVILVFFAIGIYHGIRSHDRNRQILVVCLLTILATGMGSPVLWIPRFSEIIMLVLAVAIRSNVTHSRHSILAGT